MTAVNTNWGNKRVYTDRAEGKKLTEAEKNYLAIRQILEPWIRRSLDPAT